MIMQNNLGRQYSLHADEYKKKACEILDSGWYVLGKEVLCGRDDPFRAIQPAGHVFRQERLRFDPGDDSLSLSPDLCTRRTAYVRL